jgi:hypothetical protein
MIADGFDDDAISMNDGEDAVRKSRFSEESSNLETTQRRLFRRFKHERIAQGDRHGDHPERDHKRKIERCDAGNHAQGVADRLALDATADLLDLSRCYLG